MSNPAETTWDAAQFISDLAQFTGQAATQNTPAGLGIVILGIALDGQKTVVGSFLSTEVSNGNLPQNIVSDIGKYAAGSATTGTIVALSAAPGAAVSVSIAVIAGAGGAIGALGYGWLLGKIWDWSSNTDIIGWLERFPNYATLFNSGQQFVYRRDPLALDLDGDGIETTAVTANTPTMFDYNGDGTKTATGWIKSDDSFLVLDRNGNGTIDNGSELFSDYTPLNSGGNATNGFAALQDQDTNNDGTINNLDANWNNLRVWQDANSDGISQAEELHTLDDLSISGINTAKTNTTQTLADGNTIKGTGTYTKTDGTTGQTADVNLKVDTSNQQFANTITISPEAAALPDMTGSGMVRSLREATSLSPTIQTILTQYSQATTRNEQLAIIDQLLYAWADTSGMAKTMDERDPEHYRVQYNGFGNVLRYNSFVNTGNTGSGSGGSSGGSAGPYVPDVENTMLTETYSN